MANNEPFSVSVSTISGARFTNALNLFATYKPELRYYPRMLLSLLVSAISAPFEIHERFTVERKLMDFKIEQDPVFILGHWRSGTTLLHNLMSQDPQMAFVDTYQGIFPGMTFSGRKIFEWFMKSQMPETRPSDNVKLSPHFPQEEEFAVGHSNPYGFYNFWFFPKQTRELYHRHVRFENVTESVEDTWMRDYEILVKKAIKSQGKPRFLSKNPPHTGRIPTLLKMYPNARFVYIYRNPVTVFFSTLKLFTSTMPSLQFHQLTRSQIEQNIFYLYEHLFYDYHADKKLIPEGNLIELKYEEFRPDMVNQLQKIYNDLSLPGFEKAEPHFRSYAESQKSFVSNKYEVSRKKVEEVLERFNFAMKAWNYKIPDHFDLKG